MKLKRKKKGKDKVEKDKSELNLVVPVDSPHIERKTESVYTMTSFHITQSPTPATTPAPVPAPPPPPSLPPPPPPPPAKGPPLSLPKHIKKAAPKKEAQAGPASFLQELSLRKQSDTQTRLSAIAQNEQNRTTKPSNELLLEIKNLRPNMARRLEAVKKTEETIQLDNPKKKTSPLNPVLQQIERITPNRENRLNAIEKIEQDRLNRKMPLDFTLHTRPKMAETELQRAKSVLKRAPNVSLEVIEAKLVHTNSENYKRQKELVASNNIINDFTEDSAETEIEEDTSSELVSMLQSMMNGSSTKSDDDDSDYSDDSAWGNDNNEDLVTFLLQNVLPPSTTNNNASSNLPPGSNPSVNNDIAIASPKPAPPHTAWEASNLPGDNTPAVCASNEPGPSLPDILPAPCLPPPLRSLSTDIPLPSPSLNSVPLFTRIPSVPILPISILTSLSAPLDVPIILPPPPAVLSPINSTITGTSQSDPIPNLSASTQILLPISIPIPTSIPISPSAPTSSTDASTTPQQGDALTSIRQRLAQKLEQNRNKSKQEEQPPKTTTDSEATSLLQTIRQRVEVGSSLPTPPS